MVWTETTRARYERTLGRYASDLTDQEWALISPLLRPPKTTGRPRSASIRDVLDAVVHHQHGLPMARGLLGKKPGPIAGVIDNQSIKTTKSGGVCGFDAPLSDVNMPEKGHWTVAMPGQSAGIGDWTIQIVERSFAWLNRCRRLAKDWEKSIESSQEWILVAHIKTLSRRIVSL